VLYFGQAGDAAGTSLEEIDLPSNSSVAALVSKATREHRPLQRLTSSLRIAVNEEIAGADDRLNDGDVVAFLPPVAGG
jgi:molybdopterin converting factor subunit 1